MGAGFDFNILSIMPWVRRELVADCYGKDRVFIAGDEDAVLAIAVGDELAPHTGHDGKDLEVEIAPHGGGDRCADFGLAIGPLFLIADNGKAEAVASIDGDNGGEGTFGADDDEAV